MVVLIFNILNIIYFNMNKIDNLNNKKLDVSSLAIEQMGKILSFEKNQIEKT